MGYFPNDGMHLECKGAIRVRHKPQVAELRQRKANLDLGQMLIKKKNSTYLWSLVEVKHALQYRTSILREQSNGVGQNSCTTLSFFTNIQHLIKILLYQACVSQPLQAAS
jgi:hypothetical protein